MGMVGLIISISNLGHLISLFRTNIDNCTHILLNHNFISTVRNSNKDKLIKLLLKVV
jgi:hypothetical protein